MMMKVAIYTRVSTTQQVDEGFSLQAQYDRLVEFVQLQQWDLIRIYTDPGMSAKDLNRPGVKEMITDLENNKFDALIVHKLDRLTRNISDLYDLVELVNKQSVKLISLSENIDTSTPMGRMFIYILGIFAQMFRENLREEVRKGLTKRAEQGLRNTFAPYGYEMDENGQLVIVPEQAELIREIFALLTEKKFGYGTIAKHLNMDSVSGIRGGAFYGSTIEKILKNYTYIGKNHWKRSELSEENRIIVDGGHEPIIDVEMFNKAQNIINRRSRKEMSRSFYDYPYSSIIKCGKCGGPYHGIKSSYNTYYYRCFYRLRGQCDQPSISESIFEEMFFTHFSTLNQGIPFAEVATASEDLGKERKRIERDLHKSESRRKNWQYAFGDGKIPYEDYVKLIDEEMERVHNLQKQLELLPDEKPVSVTKDDVIDTIAGLQENWAYIERATKKDFINSLFQSIVIRKDDKKWSIINVEWA